MKNFSLFYFKVLPCLFCLLIGNASGYMVGDNPYHRVETLDAKGKYQLEWKVDWSEKRVTFNVTVETRGYVGFGLSSKGKMTGADIVIGGVLPNGQFYFSDRHAVAQQIPKEDPSQDWSLHEATESDTHTFLSFSRDFDTCDPQDYPITEDKISLIWAYGERDNDLAYHHRNRGEYPVYLLHPDYSPPIVHHANVGAPDLSKALGSSTLYKDLKVWTMSTSLELQGDETAYWCSIHKAPALAQKHHFVGIEARFPNEQSRRHIHHLGQHRCHAPAGRNPNQMFGDYLNHPGQLCFAIKAPLGPMPTEYCSEFYQVYAVGARPYFFPPHVGFPLGEDKDEYYLLQVHYDNPERLSNVRVDLLVDFYYTSDLRPNDGGVLVVRHELPGVTPSLLVPPHSIDHKVYGLCGRECSHEIIPSEGIRIFGLLLHLHDTGVASRLHQFRGKRELPWVENDDNYAFDYQQTRVLNRETRIMPGDQMAIRCTYDNSKGNGTTVGGYSSRQEMCAAFIYYYSKIPNYLQCSSEIESGMARQRFLGMGNVTWSIRDIEFLSSSPDDHLAGMKVTQVSDNYVNWNMDRREEFQDYILKAPHVNRCPRELYSLSSSEGGDDIAQSLSSGRSENDADPRLRTVSYPHEAKPYRRVRTCPTLEYPDSDPLNKYLF